jgi:MFS family permease
MKQEKTVTATYKDASQPILMIRGKPVNPRLVLISLVFGFFMSLLDITIVNIAIPSIQSSLNTNLTTVTWVLNAYSLVFAILLVTMGRFADQYGRKRLFMIGTRIMRKCLRSDTLERALWSSSCCWLSMRQEKRMVRGE